jgi:bacteriocin-like protein
MEQILCELTETELASVAGGQTFNFTLNNQDSNQGIQVQKVSIVELIFYNRPTTSIVNVVNNSMNIGGP